MAMTLKKLQIIEYGLTERDKEILKLIRDTKSLFTYHIRRVFFCDAANSQAAARATNRNLKKLRDLGLIDALEDRRIGGVRAGSSSYIWFLTEQGNRLLDLDKKYQDDDKPKRTRFSEPADVTLSHRMAISECYVQLKELEQEERLKVKEASFEPNNWQYFNYKGKQEILKPDLTLVVSHHGFEYRFLIELDLGTESISTVTSKCIRYHKYRKSGLEQTQHGIFPLVLWIVKDEKRREKLEDAIRKQFKHSPSIFIVTTAEEFSSLISNPMIPEDRLC